MTTPPPPPANLTAPTLEGEDGNELFLAVIETYLQCPVRFSSRCKHLMSNSYHNLFSLTATLRMG